MIVDMVHGDAVMLRMPIKPANQASDWVSTSTCVLICVSPELSLVISYHLMCMHQNPSTLQVMYVE